MANERTKSPTQLTSLHLFHWEIIHDANIKVMQQLTSITWLQKYLYAHKQTLPYFFIQR